MGASDIKGVNEASAPMAAATVAATSSTFDSFFPEAACHFATARSCSSEQQVPELDAIIIGAGISGLAAARVLALNGQRIIVLEARKRLGGRIHTVDLPAIPELELGAEKVDLGANYLHGCSSHSQADQPLFHLGRHLGVVTTVAPSDLLYKYRGWESCEVAAWRDERTGKPIPLETVADMCFLFDQVLLQAYNMVKAMDRMEAARTTFEDVFQKALKMVMQLPTGGWSMSVHTVDSR